MTELERRVNLLEKKLARIEAMDISEGKEKPKHLGKKSKEVLEQEISSHNQNYRETFTKHEKAVWQAKKIQLEKELSEL